MMKWCRFCEKNKPSNKFYIRKTGPQKGTTVSICIDCNTDECRIREYRKRLQAGTLNDLIADLEHRLELARIVLEDAEREKRDAEALEISRKILEERRK